MCFQKNEENVKWYLLEQELVKDVVSPKGASFYVRVNISVKDIITLYIFLFSLFSETRWKLNTNQGFHKKVICGLILIKGACKISVIIKSIQYSEFSRKVFSFIRVVITFLNLLQRAIVYQISNIPCSLFLVPSALGRLLWWVHNWVIFRVLVKQEWSNGVMYKTVVF